MCEPRIDARSVSLSPCHISGSRSIAVASQQASKRVTRYGEDDPTTGTDDTGSFAQDRVEIRYVFEDGVAEQGAKRHAGVGHRVAHCLLDRTIGTRCGGLPHLIKPGVEAYFDRRVAAEQHLCDEAVPTSQIQDRAREFLGGQRTQLDRPPQCDRRCKPVLVEQQRQIIT